MNVVHASLLLALVSLLLSGTAIAQTQPIDFNRDVRPILRTHCTGCHGGVKAAGGVSFVYRDGALAEGDSGEPTISPGKADESELMRRIQADEDERMPPPDHGRALTEDEVDTLTRWIDEGAQWGDVWSLQRITVPAIPESDTQNWGKRSLDAFVLEKMVQRDLRPSEPARPADWLRRVTLDLTGVPPSIHEFEEFVANYEKDADQAKRTVVDRLLVSPRFGERWATMWLDLARYSDTHGYEKDLSRTIWPWKDWVIRAFNKDMPFDTFTLKQIAGDLLPDATPDDFLATAFHRNTLNNSEGGTDDEEFRYAAVVDRVSTIWTAWHATTFGCVRCHSHPYDPFSHEEFYQYLSLFNNSEDCDQNDDFPRMSFTQDSDRNEELFRLQRQLATALEQRNELGRSAVEAATDWEVQFPAHAQTSAGTIEVTPIGEVIASGTLPVGVVSTITLDNVAGLTALRMHLHPDSEDPLKWPERGQVISQIEIRRTSPSKQDANTVDGDSSKPAEQPIPIRAIIADYLAGPFDPSESLAAGAPGFGSFPVMNGARWCVVLLQEPIASDCDSIQIRLTQSAQANGGSQGCPLRKFHIEATASPVLTQWANSDELTEVDQVIADLRSRRDKINGILVPVLKERSHQSTRATYLLNRGDRTSPDKIVSPDVPSILKSDENEKFRTRLDLARWMCSSDNPLTSRTLANRLWYEMFGTGIVETVEDMGTSGTEPSHPELLDHLSHRLVHDFKWSIKSFLREIALSSTYGQTSKASDDRLAADPFNRWLSRGPRVRLTAEMVRDQALTVSGLLSDKAFGPPVFPPQPEGVWNSVYSGATWKPSTGEDRFRRAIYTFQKRTSGYPGFLTFDAPSRDVCTPRRVVTNTPLQALVALNDPALIEMAQALAGRMNEGGASPEQKIRFGCKLFTLDEPDLPVVTRLATLYNEAVEEYRVDIASASGLGKSPEEAAMVLVANAIFNLDMFLVR